MNLSLKLAVVASGRPAYQIASELGITDTRLSKIILGLLQPRPEEQIKLATILGKKESELFPEKKTEVTLNE